MPSTPSRFRLASDVRPVEYDLHLAPDLEAGTFRGEVSITVTLAKPRRDVRLHAADLAITRASARTDAGEIAARASLQKHDETVTLVFARPLPAGTATLALAFEGKLNQHLRGFYAACANDRPYAFTQCETADARRILPCFDEPAFKARWRVAVTAATSDTVLGNAPVLREEPAGDGRRTVHLAPTPPLSSYLLAVAVGPLEATAPRACGTTPVRVWHVPGKAHLAEFGLEAGVEALRRLEDYFGLPYPYEKLDLVAVPDFEAGAMENAGAVFFRDAAPARSRDGPIAGEARGRGDRAPARAHMWYGDLVTMAWCDDLWLTGRSPPGWRTGSSTVEARMADVVGLSTTVRARSRSTRSRRRIRAGRERRAGDRELRPHHVREGRGGRADDRALSRRRHFRDGVRRYMERHREGNAVAADLWRALAEASGKDVARVAQAWIAQPGFPLVSIDATKSVTIRQERFFADPKIPAGKRRARWPVPLVAKLPGGRLERTLADKPSQTITIAGERPEWIFGNASAGGFYRVRHDAATRALLANLSSLTAVERLNSRASGRSCAPAGRRRASSTSSTLRRGDRLRRPGGITSPLAHRRASPGTARPQAAFRRWLGALRARLRLPGWRADVARRRPAASRVAPAHRRRDRGSARGDERRRPAPRAVPADRSALEPNLADPVVHRPRAPAATAAIAATATSSKWRARRRSAAGSSWRSRASAIPTRSARRSTRR
jgi:puromycin-sensitive aminopeptidase